MFTVAGTEDWTAVIESMSNSVYDGSSWVNEPFGFSVVHSQVVGGNTQYEVSRPDWAAFEADDGGMETVLVSAIAPLTGGSYGMGGGMWDTRTLLSVDQFPATLDSLAYAFKSVFNAFTLPDTLPSTVTDLKFAFYSAIAFNSDISGWDVSNVTNMRWTFLAARAFNSDISGWDVSNVTNFRATFQQTEAFNQDLSSWNVCTTNTINFDNAATGWSLPRPAFGEFSNCFADVTFDLAGGTSADADPVSISYTGTFESLPTATRDGFTLLGWFTAAAAGTEVTTDAPHGQMGDFTLFAQWEEIETPTPEPSQPLSLSQPLSPSQLLSRQKLLSLFLSLRSPHTAMTVSTSLLK